MTRTLYLHIGLPKTGSTFLQRRVFPALSHLRVVTMPDNTLFNDGGTRLLEGIFSRSETIWQREADKLLDALFGTGWNIDQRSILLSDEAIGRTLSRQSLCSGHLSAMQDALLKRGIDRIKVLCFIRRQDHWLASHYVQVSDRRKHAGQRDFEEIVDQTLDPRGSRYSFGALIDFAAHYRAIADAIGEADICMLPMEWLADNRQGLQRAMNEWLDTRLEDLPLEQGGSENVRRQGQSHWQLRSSNWQSLVRGKLTIKQPNIELNPALSNRILAAYRSSNLSVSEMTEIDLGALGYLPSVAQSCEQISQKGVADGV